MAIALEVQESTPWLPGDCTEGRGGQGPPTEPQWDPDDLPFPSVRIINRPAAAMGTLLCDNPQCPTDKQGDECGAQKKKLAESKSTMTLDYQADT